MRAHRVAVAVLLVAAVSLGGASRPAVSSPSTQSGPGILTNERIFATADFAAERFGPARWLADGSGYTTVERSSTVQGGDDIVRYDPETDAREILVPASRFVPAGSSSPLGIDDYAWSDDGTKLLLYTNSQRVWRRNTRGDYWVIDLQNGGLQQLGGDAEPASLMFAKFSPDATRVAYVRENNVYVEDHANSQITALTTDGSTNIINGTFDWVYEEELGLRDGFRWSPDGTKIAYWQLDTEGARDFYLINNTDTLYPEIIPIPYPKVGTTNSSSLVGVVDAGGGATRWVSLPGDPRQNYLARMEWAASSEEIIIQRLNRLQNVNTVMLGDVAAGDARTILVDQDEAWVNVVNDLVWLEGGQYFTWVSERDGWRHAYLVSRDGGQVTTITPEAFDIISIQSIDVDGGWLYYIASPDSAAQRYLYRRPLDGGGTAERLTPMDQPGTHSYQISADSAWAFHTYSAFGVPPVIELIRLPDHSVARVMVDNARLHSTVEALDRGDFEFFRVEIDAGGEPAGTPVGATVELDGYIMKPPDFDAGKQYPLLFHVYGEPAGQTVNDSWGGSGYLWHLMLTQQGYLVASVDNRGTPAPRGREWRKMVYGQIGILASKDQAAAARVIRDWDFVDASRIGIWGWSGGGSMTLNMMFRSPEIYHTGMSVAPVPDQLLYDTIYQERYMGLPESNPEGFREGSPITHAANLEGNLLVVHGTGDDNVHYQGTERLINVLIENNKPFTMMAYPNRTHSIAEGRNTTLHLRELLTRYLTTHLLPGPR
ncbi:MAG: S9 family peptidase [Planctomycetota bacterium]|nr:S9 family peptidase [Planctomycetota bacterium]